MILASIEPSIAIIYAAMAVGFIGMIWAMKNMSTKPNARIFMGVFTIVVFGAVAARLFFVSPADAEDSRLIKNQIAFQNAKAEKAASYIADRFQGGSVAFIIEESSMKVAPEEGMDSFVLQQLQAKLTEKGLTCGDVIEVGKSKTEVDRSGVENTVMEDPTDAAILKSRLDQVYDKVDIVVNFAGLPEKAGDFKKINFLMRKNTATGKNNMLLLADRGLPFLDQELIKSGRVSAILDRPDAPAFDYQKDTAPKDLDEAFTMSFILLDKDSLADFVSSSPNYFIMK